MPLRAPSHAPQRPREHPGLLGLWAALRDDGAALWLAVLLFGLFVVARLAHTWAYATAQHHVMRATLYSVGSLLVMVMAV